MPTIYSRRHARGGQAVLARNEYVVLTVGVTNGAGRNYSRDVVDAALADLYRKASIGGLQYGFFISDYNGMNSFGDVTIFSHTYSDFRFQGDDLIVKINPLRTPKGMELAMMMANDDVEFRTAGLVKQEYQTSKIIHLEILSITAGLKGTSA